MGHSIPVFIFVIDPSEIPSPLSSWLDAQDFISKRWNQWDREGDSPGFLQSVSRNWWHQHLLSLLRQAYGIQGLEFTAREVACLRKEALLAADAGLVRLFQNLESQDLPCVELDSEMYSDILGEDYLEAFHQAYVTQNVEQEDRGFEAAVSFFSFLKSLQAIIAEALRTSQCLLYLMPDFNLLVGGYDEPED